MPCYRVNKHQSQENANRIIHMYKNTFNKNSNLCWKHFKKEGVKKSTFYRYIKIFGECENAVFKKNPGRPAKIATPKVVARAKKLFEKKPDITVTAVANKVKMERSYLQKIKVEKMGFKARVKQKVPAHKKDQYLRANCRLPRLEKKILRKIVIMDDETPVFSDPSEIATRQYFHSSNPDEVDPKFKQIKKSSNPKKFMLWQAIDQFGNISEPYVHEGTMRQDDYLEKCIKDRLIPFIERYHKTNQIIFWPDLATIHYSRNVQKYLKSKFSVVNKDENPPKVPHLRPIERFWALCKSRYSKLSGYYDTPRKVSFQWKKISTEVAKTYGKNIMKKLKKKINYEAKNGAQSSINMKI